MTKPLPLLVDDDAETVQVLGRMLAAEGRIQFALNGDDALRLARETPPDLILLDAEMPGRDGFSVCRALKADPQLAGVPVIGTWAAPLSTLIVVAGITYLSVVIGELVPKRIGQLHPELVARWVARPLQPRTDGRRVRGSCPCAGS